MTASSTVSPTLSGRYLTINQVCALVHRCPRTVRRWIRQGDLPGTRRVKDGYLIPMDALDRMLVPVDCGEEDDDWVPPHAPTDRTTPGRAPPQAPDEDRERDRLLSGRGPLVRPSRRLREPAGGTP